MCQWSLPDMKSIVFQDTWCGDEWGNRQSVIEWEHLPEEDATRFATETIGEWADECTDNHGGSEAHDEESANQFLAVPVGGVSGSWIESVVSINASWDENENAQTQNVCKLMGRVRHLTAHRRKALEANRPSSCKARWRYSCVGMQWIAPMRVRRFGSPGSWRRHTRKWHNTPRTGDSIHPWWIREWSRPKTFGILIKRE